MAAGVRCHALNAQPAHQAVERFAHIVVVARDACFRGQQVVGFVAVQPLPDVGDNVRVQRNHAVTARGCLFAANQVAVVEMHILPPGRQQFIQPHAGVDKHQCNAGSLSKAGVIGHAADALHFFRGQHTRLRVAGVWQHQCCGVVRVDDVLIDGVLAQLRKELPLLFAQAAAGTFCCHLREDLLVVLGFQFHDAAVL